MLLEGLRGWGEKRGSVRGGREAQGGGGVLFSYHSVNGGKGC